MFDRAAGYLLVCKRGQERIERCCHVVAGTHISRKVPARPIKNQEFQVRQVIHTFQVILAVNLSLTSTKHDIKP